MLRWLGKNFNTLLLALVLSVGVWVAAVNEADPNQELIYPTPIMLEVVGQNPNLLITNSYSEQIELTLRAPRSVWTQLTADENSIHAVIDLSGYGVGEHIISPQIQIGLEPVKLVVVDPPSITIVLEELISATIPVDMQVEGEPSVGYQVGTIGYSPKEVDISGPRSLVERVVSIQANFDLSDARESVDEALTLRILDEFGDRVDGLTLSDDLVQLSVPISQQGGYRDVAVKVLVTGQVANLHRLTNISVFPPVVTLYSSDPELVSGLSGVVETEALDITGIDDDISARLQLTLPENVQLVGDQTVLVTASVEAILGSQTISEQAIEVINLDPELSALLSSLTVDVIVSGPLSALDSLSPTDLRVFVNVDGLGIGTHQLTPSFEILNDDIQVESILPESIEVILDNAPQLTPTPLP